MWLKTGEKLSEPFTQDQPLVPAGERWTWVPLRPTCAAMASTDLPPLERVRVEDYDRYLTLLHAPAAARPALAALYALNLELGRIRELVSEPLLGEIRLTWWREAVEGAYAGHPRAHPLVQAIASHLPARGVPQDGLDALIEARTADIVNEQPRTVDDLVQYVAATAGQLTWLAAVACTGSTDVEPTAARAAGRAWGLTGVIRAVGFHAATQRLMLPDDALQAAGIDPDTLFRGEIGPQLAPVLQRLAALARADIEQVRSQWRSLPSHVRSPLLVARLAQDYLDRLAACGFDLSQFDPGRGALARQLALLKVGLTGRL
jgi:phytoene synthase